MKKIITLFILLSFSSSLFAEAPPLIRQIADGGKNPVVHFKTNLGNFTVELYPDMAPATVENFLSYVSDNFYNNTLFHRVIPGFMAQGGGFEKGMVKKPTKSPVRNESLSSGLRNERGTIAMARLNDPHSATSQFFINVVDNWNLDAKGKQHGYTVFGKVTEGMDIVDTIVNVPTASVNYYRNVPRNEVVILSVGLSQTDTSKVRLAE